MEINKHTYEELFLRYVDNELSDAEKQQVDEFVRRYPEYGVELQVLQQSVCIPDTAIRFNGKEALYRKRAPVFALGSRIAAAAAVLLLTGIAGWLFLGNDSRQSGGGPLADSRQTAPAGERSIRDTADPAGRNEDPTGTAGSAGLNTRGPEEPHDRAGIADNATGAGRDHTKAGISLPSVPTGSAPAGPDKDHTTQKTPSAGTTNIVPAKAGRDQINSKTPPAPDRAGIPTAGSVSDQTNTKTLPQPDPSAIAVTGTDRGYANAENLHQAIPDPVAATPPPAVNGNGEKKPDHPSMSVPEYAATGQPGLPIHERAPAGYESAPQHPVYTNDQAGSWQDPSQAVYANDDDDNDVIYFANAAIPKQNKLRGIFRTASRIIDKVTSSDKLISSQ